MLKYTALLSKSSQRQRMPSLSGTSGSFSIAPPKGTSMVSTVFPSAEKLTLIFLKLSGVPSSAANFS